MKKEHGIVLLAFLGGIVLANLVSREMLMTYGILNEYFLSQYSYQTVDGKRLLCHILVERGKVAFTIFLLGKVMNGKVFAVLIKSLVAAGIGFLIVVAIVNLGVKGIVISLMGLFPQWIFYLAALILYGSIRSETEYSSLGRREMYVNAPGQIVRWILIVLCMGLGVMTESYINPILLAYILKFF